MLIKKAFFSKKGANIFTFVNNKRLKIRLER